MMAVSRHLRTSFSAANGHVVVRETYDPFLHAPGIAQEIVYRDKRQAVGECVAVQTWVRSAHSSPEPFQLPHEQRAILPW
jgi:hypothetical protein